MNLTPPSQLFIRNVDQFESGAALINPPNDALLRHPAPALKAVYGYDFRLEQMAKPELPIRVQASFNSSAENVSHLILFWPKAKQQGMMMLENWLDLLQSNQSLFLIGENRSGIKSISKPLKERGIQLSKVDSARHCVLYRVQLESAVQPFELSDWYKEYQIAYDGSAQEVSASKLSIMSLPGVFSHGSLDLGTRILLDSLPTKIKGKRFADIGCGSGIISAYLARQYPEAQMTASDINALALASTQKTAEVNQLDNLSAIPSDGLSVYERRSLDLIITNPPFHEGLNTEYEVTLSLLREAPKHLAIGGQLILVANQFLDYESTLKQGFRTVKSLAETQGFKVLQAFL